MINISYLKFYYVAGMTLLEVMLATTLGAFLLAALLACWQHIDREQQNTTLLVARDQQVRSLYAVFYDATHNLALDSNSEGNDVTAQVIPLDEIPNSWKRSLRPRSDVLLLDLHINNYHAAQQQLTAFYLADNSNYSITSPDVVVKTALYKKVLAVNDQQKTMQRIMILENVAQIKFNLFCLHALSSKKTHYSLFNCSREGVKSNQKQHALVDIQALLAYRLLKVKHIDHKYWWQGSWHNVSSSGRGWPYNISYLPMRFSL